MKSSIVLGAILLGFVLLGIGSFWTSLFPATSSWTNEKSLRLGQVKDRITNLTFKVNSPTNRIHAGEDPATMKAELDQLIKENEQLNADFTSAYDRPNTVAKILKWSGISLAGVGIVGWYAVNQSR